MAKLGDQTIRRRAGAAIACVSLSALATPAVGQRPNSQPVVQPSSPSALNLLNVALRDLARDPGNVPALLRAGWASLDLDDTQSALGFFRRAQALQPQNGEAKAGLATADLRTGDPVSAVNLFTVAQTSGTPMADYAADRGLALDLVGDNAAAQQFYRQALAQKYDAEVVRRLALSQAIGGDEAATEATLLPLLQRRDLAAYRTRAFALAILGKGEEAVSIAETMLPAQISGRLAPYLRYMPRLTRAQQAAAANLGQFPPASEIGHDSPQIAALSAASATAKPTQLAAATPDSRLVPTGKGLGRSSRTDRGTKRDAGQPVPKPKRAQVAVTYTPLAPATPPAALSPSPAPAPAQPSAAATQILSTTPRPGFSTPPFLPPPRVAAAVQQPPLQPENKPAAVAAAEPPAAPPPPEPRESKPVVVAALEPPPSSAPPAPPVEQAATPSTSAPPASEPVAAAPSPAPQATKPISLAEAFADLASAPPASSSVATKTKSAPGPSKADQAKAAAAKAKLAADKAKADEAKAEAAKAKAKAKANPERFWVQVATGRDMKALAFTWRRLLQREGGSQLAKYDPYSAKWGATRRLLAGPYKSEAEADKAVGALKKKGFDAFEFTSDEGEEVIPLP